MTGTVFGMGGLGGSGRYGRIARLFGLSAGCLALANCANNNMTSSVDPKYGVAASPRVVALGQPAPKGGGVYRVGKPYTIGGREYVPQENIHYSTVGMASWYGDDFHGRFTANGEIFDMNALSAAHPTLPLPSYVRVTNLANRRSIVVRVNDRGPYVGNRVIDVSVRTAKLLGFFGDGLARVRVDYVGRAPLEGSDDRKLAATLREDVPGLGSHVLVASSGGYAPDAQVPAPPDRPFRLGEGGHNVPAYYAPRETMELAAARRPLEPAAVSAYAPPHYDAPAEFISGRGLY